MDNSTDRFRYRLGMIDRRSTLTAGVRGAPWAFVQDNKFARYHLAPIH